MKAGFSRVDITPALHTPVHGYFEPRYVTGVLDPLQADVLALASGNTKVLLISLDLCEVCADVLTPLRQRISAATGVAADGIFIAATHNHTGPCILSEAHAKSFTMFGVPFDEDQLQLLRNYRCALEDKLVGAAVAAVEDIQPATLSHGSAECSGVSFVRRYRMKDGGIRTNPGIGNPDIAECLGQADTQMCVLQLKRDKDSILLAHFGNHADTVGGSDISADWVGVMRARIEKAVSDSRCMFFNGGEGNVNHFDAMLTNPEYSAYLQENRDIMAAARYCGEKCAQAALKALENAVPAESSGVSFESLSFAYPSKSGDGDISVPLFGIFVGDVAFIGIPGEPFAETAIALKRAGERRMVLPCSLVNGFLDYFPTMDALDGSSYEARSCRFVPGIAEKIEENGVALLAKSKM